MKTFRWLPVLAALLSICGVVNAQDKPLATFTAPGETRMLGQGSGSLGFRFAANAPFTVSALGYYDATGQSLTGAHVVALFDEQGQEIENSRAQVGPDSPLEKDGFRYEPIKPLALKAGVYTISGFAGLGKKTDNTFTRSVTGLKLADGFTYRAGVYGYATEFGVGDKVEAAANYFGPNLKVRAAAKTIKVACIGDSITVGSGVADHSRESYPAVLQNLLGAAYTVSNFGVSGATLLKKGDKPYWTQPQFEQSADFAPDMVIIMLGTNDSKPRNWVNKADFASDYRDLIVRYATLPSHPRVFVVLSPPVYNAGAFSISPTNLENEVVPLIKEVGGDTIDARSALNGHPEWFPDTVHPNKAGAAAIAQAVYEAVRG